MPNYTLKDIEQLQQMGLWSQVYTCRKLKLDTGLPCTKINSTMEQKTLMQELKSWNYYWNKENIYLESQAKVNKSVVIKERMPSDKRDLIKFKIFCITK